MTLLGPTSTSELGTLACPRKYMYRYGRKLAPKRPNTNMAMGTFWHQCAAAGYKAGDRKQWLSAALAESRTPDPIDRDGIPLGLEEENIDAVRDMLCYYWEHQGRFDEFEEILIVDEERYFEFAGWSIRFTIDLAVKMHGKLILFDHKTSGDISGDRAYLPIDLQTHLYYYGAWKTFERPAEFIHNWVRRFDFTSDQRVGPPSWARLDGSKPYLHTKSGKVATRSDEVGDYVQRDRTPLQESQLRAFEDELTAQLQTLRFHQISDQWPRYGQKLATGCSNCPYYAVCSTEMDGNPVNQMALDMAFVKLP